MPTAWNRDSLDFASLSQCMACHSPYDLPSVSYLIWCVRVVMAAASARPWIPPAVFTATSSRKICLSTERVNSSSPTSALQERSVSL